MAPATSGGTGCFGTIFLPENRQKGFSRRPLAHSGGIRFILKSRGAQMAKMASEFFSAKEDACLFVLQILPAMDLKRYKEWMYSVEFAGRHKSRYEGHRLVLPSPPQ